MMIEADTCYKPWSLQRKRGKEEEEEEEEENPEHAEPSCQLSERVFSSTVCREGFIDRKADKS